MQKFPRPRSVIKVYLGSGASVVSEQGDWPESIKCPRCKDIADLLMVVHDPQGSLVSDVPTRVKTDSKLFWFHDAVAIALYVCPKCGEIEAKWNQA